MQVRAVILAIALLLASSGAKAADLVVWWEEEFAPGESDAVREMMADFEKSTGKTVELTFVEYNALPDRLQTALAAGAPPDFQFGSTINRWVPEWAQEDRLVELSAGLWRSLGDEAGGDVSSVMVQVTRKDTPWRRIPLSRCRDQELPSRRTRSWRCCARVPGGC